MYFQELGLSRKSESTETKFFEGPKPALRPTAAPPPAGRPAEAASGCAPRSAAAGNDETTLRLAGALASSSQPHRTALDRSAPPAARAQPGPRGQHTHRGTPPPPSPHHHQPPARALRCDTNARCSKRVEAPSSSRHTPNQAHAAWLPLTHHLQNARHRRFHCIASH
jgi:hypothetical protein